MVNPRLPILTACLLTLASALHGCGLAGSEDMAGSLEPRSLCGQPWLLKSLKVDGREHRTGLLWRKLMRERPYFTCDALGYVRGNSGSNPYTGRLSRSGDQLSWPKAPAVAPMIDLRDSSELEQDFLLALPQTEQLSFDGELLILEGAAGATRLEFQPAETPPP
ncbi:META domain-containing protein [Microbulbifer zhoushanensis]|uniref:META domain-containing protein n=1 Tax=Microbulbifer zhoushanensis TaxID=2904254 RepID=UPI001F282932|nr:META domain-containing protein [Microbulbifer zhoushanensis]